MEIVAAAVNSWASDRLDIFGIGTGNAMFHKSWSNGGWAPSQTDWEAIGGSFISAPAVVSWGAGRLDVFGIGSDNTMYHKSCARRGQALPPPDALSLASPSKRINPKG
jgi:hypothetical protein